MQHAVTPVRHHRRVARQLVPLQGWGRQTGREDRRGGKRGLRKRRRVGRKKREKRRKEGVEKRKEEENKRRERKTDSFYTLNI